MWTSSKFSSDKGSKCTAEHETKSESKPKNPLITKMYSFVLYQAKSDLKFVSPWGWNAIRKELSTIVVIEKRRLGTPTTNETKNQIKEHPGYCCDLESRQRCRNQKLQLRNKQSFKGQIGQPLYFGLSDPFPVSGTSLGTQRDFDSFVCMDVCMFFTELQLRQCWGFSVSSGSSQTRWAKTKSPPSWVRRRGVKYVLSESHSLLVTRWYMKAIASVCV